MENQKNNHHFVPQFYLIMFSNNKKIIGAYVLKNHRYVEQTSIKEIAFCTKQINLSEEDNCRNRLLWACLLSMQ